MHLGTVIGRVVATRKVEGLEGVKLLVVRPEDDEGRRKGPDLIMTDGAGPAGPGDRVWWIEGREAALALSEVFVPVDAGIVAIVDRVDSQGVLKQRLATLPEHGEKAAGVPPPAGRRRRGGSRRTGRRS